MNLRAIQWTGFKTKSNLYPIKIRVTQTINKKTSVNYIHLKFSVLKSQWADKDQRVKNHPNAQDYNLKIIETKVQLEKNFMSSGEVSTGDKSDLYYWFDLYKDHVKATCGLYHQKKITTVYNRLKEYSPVLSVKNLTEEFIHKYEASLLAEGLHRNYVTDQLERIRAVVKKAVKGGSLEYHKNPFNDYKLRSIKTVKQRLKLEDIHALETVALTDIQGLARDMYVFSYYCFGVRWGDLCRLKKENFKDGRLMYTMHKGVHTNNPTMVNIKVPEPALKIIKKYKYEFPVGVDWKNEEQSINARNTAFNKSLKKACKKAKIPEVTFHTSRHSIADRAIKKKFSDQQLQGILGHSRSITTQAYKKSMYQEESDEAMDNLFK